MVRRGSTVRVRQRALFSKKYLQIAQFCCHRRYHGAPPCSVETTIELAGRPAKHLQIELLPSTTEHLRGTEGLGGPGTEGCARKRPESARLHRSSLHREKKRLAIGIGLGDGTRSEEAGAGSGRRSVARPGPERVGAVTRSSHANSAPFTAGARLLRSPIAPCASGASRRRRPRASRRDHRCRPSLSPRRRSSNRRATTSRWPLCARARSG